MIELFRKNLFINSILLLPYTLLIRLKSLLDPEAYALSANEGILNEFVFTWISSPLAQNILACILIFLQAALLNRIFIKNRISNESTLLPGMFYILFTSVLPGFLGFNPILIGNTFLLIAISEMLKTYKKPRAATQIFNTGFFISIASLFYLPYLAFVVFGIIGIMSLRSFKLGERLQLICGAIIPLFLMGSWMYYSKNLNKFYPDYFSVNINVFSQFVSDQYTWITMGVFIAGIVLVVFGYNGFTMKKSIQVQKKIDVLYWIVLVSVLSIFLGSQLTESHFMVVIAPVAGLFALLFLRIRNKITMELVHLLFVAGVFFIHFYLFP